MNEIAIIGAGPAGIEAAYVLAQRGYKVTLFEKAVDTLTNIRDKAYLFPDFSSAADLADQLNRKLQHENITLKTNADIVSVKGEGGEWKLVDSQVNAYTASAVLMATGYTVFDAKRKEELGYGIYQGVVTSLEMEKMIREGHIVNSLGEKPGKIVFLQCVGSRDEKSGNHYCSKVCCVTAVKQAIEVKKHLSDTEVYLFYMDLRMWGEHFEEMYRESQEKYGVKYIRGRISEAASTFDGKVQIKAEDTLVGLPLKMSTDLLVLMVGMEPSAGTRKLSTDHAMANRYGFATSQSPLLDDNLTAEAGFFVAGTCKRPLSIIDTLNDARAAAQRIDEYMNSLR